MNIARFAVPRLNAILFVTIALCLIGLWTMFSFPVGILPDVTFPRIVIIAEAGESPPRLMEVGVSRPLEEAIATVEGVRRVRTKILRGAAEISVDFDWGLDMLVAQQLVTAKVNETRPQLPRETTIVVERMNPTVFPVLGLSLRSAALSQAQLWSLATYNIKPVLGRVPGVARAVVQGGRTPEIAVEVIPERLAAYHIGLSDIETALSQGNQVRAVGRLDRQFQQYQVLVSGETSSEEDLQRLVVAQRNNVPVTLGMVATVLRSVEDRTTVVTANGAESVLVNIVRQPTANTVSVVAGVEQELSGLKKSLPRGTEISVFYDQSVLITEAITSVRDAVLIGAALAVVILLLFLGDLRATLVTAAIIPATVLVTFLLMRLAGMTLNLMTLGALAIGVGLVIDDAIVVVENIFRHLAQGIERGIAVDLASQEIAAPMISSTLTTVVVFLPLVLVTGVAGAFFTALAVTLVIALMVSLLLALFVSPSLCAAFLRVRPGATEHGRFFDHVLHGYAGLLRFSLRHRRLFLPLGVVIVLAGTVYFASRLGTGFMPTMDEGAFVLDYRTPPGTSLAESDRILMRIEAILKETPEVRSFSRRTGQELGFAITESNTGDFAVMLKSGKRRPIDAVIEEIREKIAERAPGIETEFIAVLQDLIGDLAGAPAPIEIKIVGENQCQLEGLAKKIAASVEKIDGAVDVQSGVVESGPELTAHIDPVRSGRLGLTTDTIAAQVTTALLGSVPTQILEGDRQIAVRVRYPLSYRDSQSRLASVAVQTPSGAYLPLSAVATMENIPGASEINREDQRRLLSITANIEGRDLGSVVRDVQKIMRSETLPAGVSYRISGQYQSQNESFTNLSLVLALAILLVFGVMMFQFGTFKAPVVLLLIMPLSLFGVTLSLWVTRTPLNVSSFMGAVMLVGIVVKNGILLLDRAQKAENDGLSSEESVLYAGQVRLRPILMTTLTAILGLVPLALGIGAGAEMQKPLAIAVIGGLTFSTLFTLVFAPLLYVSFGGRTK